jgi:hypothetical protein
MVALLIFRCRLSSGSRFSAFSMTFSPDFVNEIYPVPALDTTIKMKK